MEIKNTKLHERKSIYLRLNNIIHTPVWIDFMPIRIES